MTTEQFEAMVARLQPEKVEKFNCNKGCPPNIDMRTCTKALSGDCPFVAHRKGGLYWRDMTMFNE